MIVRPENRIHHQPHPQQRRQQQLRDLKPQRKRSVVQGCILIIVQLPLHQHDEEDARGQERGAEVRDEIRGAVEGVEEVEDGGQAEPDEDWAGGDELECPGCG